MTTGAAWDVSNPLKPFARFDTDAVRDIPFDWAAWLTDIGSTYASHTISAPSPLECTTSAEASGVITARIQLLAAATFALNTKYPITCHIVAADGQEEDQTLWLKLVNK